MAGSEDVYLTQFFIFGTVGVIILVVLVISIMLSHQKGILKEQNKLKEFKLAQQRRMMEAMVDTQEKERQRIAKDLHDELNGSLASLLISNDGVVDMLKDGEEAGSIQQAIEKNKKMIREISSSARSLSHDLLPPSLRKMGLIATMGDMASSLNSSAQLDVQFESNASRTNLDQRDELSLYRVMKEWLNNVIKHSGATSIKIGIKITDKEHRITIADNGKPFDFNAAMETSKGLGLRNIAGRLDLMKANYEQSSKDGRNALQICMNCS